MDLSTFATMSGLAAAVLIPEFWILVHRTRRRTPRGVIRRLERVGDPHTVTVRMIDLNRGLWNPGMAFKGVGQFFGGRGTAVYELMTDDVVVLDWFPRHGRPEHFSGAVPLQLRKPRPPLPRAIWVLPALYLAMAALGAWLGWLSGSQDDRGDSSFAGALLGFVAASLVLSAFGGLLKRRATRT